jgi:hypothetical protein
MLVVLLIGQLFRLIAAGGLTEFPLIGDSNKVHYLDGEGWTATNGDITIGAIVPGGSTNLFVKLYILFLH